MGFGDIINNFMSGFTFGLLANSPFGCGMSFPFFGGGYNYNRVDFETFANPFPSVWGCGFPQMQTNIMPSTYANPYYPSVDFSNVNTSIWDFAMKPSIECNNQPLNYYSGLDYFNSSYQQSSYPNPYNPYFFGFPYPLTPKVNPAEKKTEKPKEAKPEEETIKPEKKQTESKKIEKKKLQTTTNTVMAASKEECFMTMMDFVFEHEGGYVNHPNDKGGPTNKGVTQKTYDGYRDKKGLPRQSVKNLTKEEAIEIYKGFFKEIGADKVDDPKLAMCMFDWANHSGPYNESLKRAIKESNGDVDKFIEMRKTFINNIIANDPSQEVFRKGWNNRINDLSAFVSNKLPSEYA